MMASGLYIVYDFIKINDLFELQEDGQISFTIPGRLSTEYTAVADYIEYDADDDYIWQGEINGNEYAMLFEYKIGADTSRCEVNDMVCIGSMYEFCANIIPPGAGGPGQPPYTFGWSYDFDGTPSGTTEISGNSRCATLEIPDSEQPKIFIQCIVTSSDLQEITKIHVAELIDQEDCIEPFHEPVPYRALSKLELNSTPSAVYYGEGQIVVELDQINRLTDMVEVYVFNSQGMLLGSKKFQAEISTLKMSVYYPPSIYFVSIKSGSKIKTLKIVIQ